VVHAVSHENMQNRRVTVRRIVALLAAGAAH
jgi:hypothetical protein